MNEKKKRGRKSKNPVNIYKTKVWVEYLTQTAKMNVNSLEKLIGEFINETIDKPYRLRRYQNGSHSPELEYIDLIEKIYPGSKAIFEHVLWEVLSSFNYNQDEINDLIQKLEPRVKFELISRVEVNPIKRKPFNEYTVESLTKIGSIDCLVVAILMIQESIFLGSEKLRELALELYAGLTEKIAQNPLFFNIHPELFDYIDKNFKHHIFLAPNIRLSAVIFWQSYRDNLWSGEMKQKSEILEASKSVTPNKETSPKTRIESSEMPSYFD
ncbi:hypothetical protein [Acinetobacter baumannii]|uniref:hypothetical protein n=2 Tax=Acinetobacter baumannii TaxID=470 RepID=UPI00062C3956|nr:hypothetical protein [Acinetobacter baumannii]KKZ37736.1 hypothetical protein UN98_17270 [Acinetobacter baumannii]TPT46452.1 hypothetical protein FJU63_15755 [Acinetobacter baumannii]HDU8433421.1 hypothetical protein [Acinetobacter baumannii]